MPLSARAPKAGRIVLAACMGIVGMALVTGPTSAQQSGQREVIRVPAERSFLNPGPVSSDRRNAGCIANGQASFPVYGPSDSAGNNLLPSSIGGGQPLIGGDRR